MMQVRMAREADVPALEAIADRTATRTDPRPPPLDLPTLASAHGVFVAVTDGGHLAGLIVLWPHPDHVLIERLAVDPGMRGGGAATALLGHAEATAAHHGLPLLRLDPAAMTPGVLAFARARGFEPAGAMLERAA